MTLSVVQNETPAAGLEALRDRLPDYAKDTRLNLGQVLTPEGAPDLTENQIAGIALASAYATRHPDVIAAIAAHTAQTLTDAEKTAAKAAASPTSSF